MAVEVPYQRIDACHLKEAVPRPRADAFERVMFVKDLADELPIGPGLRSAASTGHADFQLLEMKQHEVRIHLVHEITARHHGTALVITENDILRGDARSGEHLGADILVDGQVDVAGTTGMLLLRGGVIPELDHVEVAVHQHGSLFGGPVIHADLQLGLRVKKCVRNRGFSRIDL